MAKTALQATHLVIIIELSVFVPAAKRSSRMTCLDYL